MSAALIALGFVVLAMVVASPIVLTDWMSQRVRAGFDVEDAMNASRPDKVRAVLAMRGHMLSKHQRDAAEAWLADVVIEKGR